MTAERTAAELPPERGPFARWLGRAVLRLLRFEVKGSPPPVPKFVLIGAPHSSNWDFIVGIATFFAAGVRVSYLGKHTLFWWPLGVIMRALGGIPVDRTQRGGVVAAMVRNFEQSERLILALAPEGTRSKVPHWHEGFYHVATQAQVPVVCGFIHWGRRQAGFGPTVRPSGDKDRDLAEIRAYYEGLGPEARKDT